MKTAEKILFTALELFNQNGEAGVTSVDIAIELDISPGNLYYHFKGKEIIVAALFDMYRERMENILGSNKDGAININDFFYYLLLIMQQSHLFRFLYRSPSDLAEKYPAVSKGFQRLMKTKEDTLTRLFAYFVRQGELDISEDKQASVVALVGLIFTQAPSYCLLKGDNINDEKYIHDSLKMVLFALQPYLVNVDVSTQLIDDLLLTVEQDTNES
jgi:AcrR family transcriptional regulator